MSEQLIKHAYRLLSSVEFRVSDSPLWTAQQNPLNGYTAEQIASVIVDLQYHGF